MDQVCARGRRIHAREGKLQIRNVPEVREYMQEKKKDEMGMCRRQGNTCERGEIMDQECARGKGIHAREGEIMDWVCARGKRTHAKREKR